MRRYAIDTNVAVVANGKDETVCISCQRAAVEFLVKAIENGTIVLDECGEIQEEYRRKLNPSGQPGVGDRFYYEVLQGCPPKVKRVSVSRRADGEYADVPQPIIDAGFDTDDRKYVAVALIAKAVVCNAVDSDWVEHKEVIEANGVDIDFLCGTDPTRWRNRSE